MNGTVYLPCTACGDDSTYRADRPRGPTPCKGCGLPHALVRREDGDDNGLMLMPVDKSTWRQQLRDRTRQGELGQCLKPAPRRKHRRRRRGGRR